MSARGRCLSMKYATIAKSVCRYAAFKYGNNRVYHNSPLSDATDSKNDRNTTKQTNKTPC